MKMYLEFTIITAFFQAQFSQMRPVAITPSVAPRMPLYPPGAPGLGQQFLYGQGPPAMMPPQVIISQLFTSLTSIFVDIKHIICGKIFQKSSLTFSLLVVHIAVILNLCLRAYIFVNMISQLWCFSLCSTLPHMLHVRYATDHYVRDIIFSC